MKKKTAVLFDFDGVIANTEPQYDVYMNDVGVRYNLGIDNLAERVKGVPTVDVINKYFSHLDADELEKFKKEMLNFELTMDFPPIAGALEFVSHLKENNYPIALVTSSQQVKMVRALKLLNLEGVFDVEVTADRITKGKPHPMCFELAASDLGMTPDDCIVFEDSIHGINAGVNAKMRVVGLTTSFSEEEMEDKVIATLADFADIEKVMSLIE